MSKIAIVTGAARGIGLAAARQLIAAGGKVAMVDRDGEALADAAAGVNAALPLTLDISDPDQARMMVAETVSAFGRVDHLVNNAGVAVFGPLEHCDFAAWREVMATNLDGIFLCTQAALPDLKKTKGAIVNIASISGLRASTLRIAYGTSKAAVIHLTKQYAAELGEFGVRVNCVCPGPVRTKLAMAVHTQDIVDSYHDAIPLNRYGSEDELANAIRFLCSEDASYITGQVLAVDGGFEATGVGLPSLRAKARSPLSDE
ncbi:MAG: SDR family oxidoreductase [Pseudomonadota bacterium]